MNLETKITIYKFTPQLFTLTPGGCRGIIDFCRASTERESFKIKKYKSIAHGRYYNERQQTGCCFFQGIGQYACENEQDRR
jgi:hypothetical protein